MKYSKTANAKLQLAYNSCKDYLKLQYFCRFNFGISGIVVKVIKFRNL